MALTQSFEAIKPPMGFAEPSLEAAWVRVDSDEGDSSSSDWEKSPCASPRRPEQSMQSAAGPPTPAAAAASLLAKADLSCSGSVDDTAPVPSDGDDCLFEGACDLKSDYHPAELDSVVELSTTYKVVLKTHTSPSKPLAMFVGDSEGKALLQAFRGWKWQNQGCCRPLTYDFLTSIVEALGRKVIFVRICASERGVFYARAHFSPPASCEPDEASLNGIDSRPSDALNLALRCGAQVFIHRQLISGVN